ncbi:putative oxidoreductase YteT isoform X2 [Littorina saxatilis]|uniref:putative oxidoreductase YteT isoform X2 n=1 Tax=Littorina saxatilis TaxID=31220 RepID=UPI0038B5B783
MSFKFIRELFKLGKMSGDKKQGSGDGAKQVTCLLIGAGARGFGYAYYAVCYPEQFKIVGVADPRDFYRKRVQDENKVSSEFVFKDWREAAEREKFADCVIIATPDREHKGPAVAFAQKGYHILLEKPMAVTEEDCREIVSVCKDNKIVLAVCHVLRYMPWAYKIREIIESGEIGEVVNIQHTEPVGFWHFAHSFVRGNWHKESESSNSLLQKCCHDVDLICHWMSPQRCAKVSSFGRLSHFRRSDKPQGAGDRCLDCSIESQCPYSAKKIYLDRVKQGHTSWPVSVITEVPDIESVTEALKSGPYGRCVYECDNDVMSQQVSTFQFENGATASLTMVAFSSRLCAREVKVYGTKGEITCDASHFPKVEVFDFLTQRKREVECRSQGAMGRLSGHGGGDYLLIDSFVQALRTGKENLVLTGADDTLASHLLVFAAEKARKDDCVVHIKPDGTF